MASVRINGHDFVPFLDGIDRSDELVKVALQYGTRQTFGEARGNAPRVFAATITQDLSAGSLYRLAIGSDTAPIVGLLKPLGNAIATIAQPHFQFNVTPVGISGDTFMGGEAGTDASKSLTVEVAWLIDSWVEVTA